MTRTPEQTFWSDQALATARDAASDPSLVPVAVTAANGEQCTWCDCPLALHRQPGYSCGGCPATATSVVSTFAGPVLRYDFPACDRHTADIVASIAQVVGGVQ
ncbi:hypothetical protein ACFWDQ_16730 [Streptomyces sp. NPDC060053]|uniref:hypothetical protein n=1 Tax=Streptomyces sp. NPDC060053 TaxID=3347047 RepID=UPI0036A74C4E